MSETGSRRIKAVLFDKDGTLIDFQKSWEPITRMIARYAAGEDEELADHLLRVGGMDPETGVTRPDSLIAAASNDQLAAALVGAGAVVSVEDLLAAINHYAAGSAEHHVPVCDLADLFAELSAAGFKLGIASSDSAGSITALADRFGLRQWLGFISGYDSGHGAKPEPGMFLAFCEYVGLLPEEVAMVGDNLHDMHMGQSAGAGLTVSVLTGTGTREVLASESDMCLQGIHELVDALQNFNSDKLL